MTRQIEKIIRTHFAQYEDFIRHCALNYPQGFTLSEAFESYPEKSTLDYEDLKNKASSLKSYGVFNRIGRIRKKTFKAKYVVSTNTMIYLCEKDAE